MRLSMPTTRALSEAAAILATGGVVAFPTETHYGLAVDPMNERALIRLFELKKRATAKPILVLTSSRQQLVTLTDCIPLIYNVLMDRFWPGPLTLVFTGRAGLSPLLTGNTGTVGVRISSHPLARQLVTAFGGPITATSANISGSTPAAVASGVITQFGNAIDLVLDGGGTPGKKGSTVVGCDHDQPVLIRAGTIAFDSIAAAVAG